MNKRGAYFFVLDALIGGTIFLITVVMILNSYVGTPQTRQSYMIAEDLSSFLLNTKIIEYRDPYITDLDERGLITDPHQSIFQQIVQFHYTGENELAHNLTSSVFNSLVSEQYGISFLIVENGVETIIYNRSVDKLASAQFHLASRKISFFAINQTDYYGPDIVELRLWN
ncbi:MAG: hypothetical protein ABH828_02360 [archaeon]